MKLLCDYCGCEIRNLVNQYLVYRVQLFTRDKEPTTVFFPEDLDIQGFQLSELVLRYIDNTNYSVNIGEFCIIHKSCFQAEEFNNTLHTLYLRYVFTKPDWEFEGLRFLYYKVREKTTNHLQGRLYIDSYAHLDNLKKRVLSFCNKTDKLKEQKSNDAIKLAHDYYAEYVREQLEREKQNKQKRPGYVYVLKSPTGAYKIGRTVAPEDRLKTFTVKLPFEVSYEVLIKADDYIWLEKKLHAEFDHKRINGEWFALDNNDIEYLKKQESA